MPRCSICIHADRAEIDKALIAGHVFRDVAQRFAVSRDALFRHKRDHLVDLIAIAERNIEQRINGQAESAIVKINADALDVHGELRNIFHRMNKLMDACDSWLTDPDDPAVYNLNPRAHELMVTYEEVDDSGDRPFVRRRKKKLSQLIAEIEGNLPSTTVTMVETKSADPRDLIVKTANALRPSVELLAKLVGVLDESPKSVTQIQIIEIARPS